MAKKKKGKSPPRGRARIPMTQLPEEEAQYAIRKKVLHLPMFEPGIVIKVPLNLLPTYMDFYHLEPNGMSATGTLLVKRVVTRVIDKGSKDAQDRS